VKRFRYIAAGCLALAVAATGVLFSPLARSATQAPAAALPAASAVFKDWNAAFLVQGTNGPYYATTLKSVGTKTSGTWVDALDIAVAEDVYEHTHLPAEWELVKNLVTVFLEANGTNWASYDGWNDDLGWMINATLRGYQATGDKSWLNVAATQWNDAYNRGWTLDGGGGVWENSTHFSKCAVSNGPMVFNGVSLYRITGTVSYLTKAEAIYKWMKANLVNSATGQVNDCIAFPDGTGGPTELQGADLPYDAGVFIEDGDLLYRATGNKQYASDAALGISHWVDNDPVVTSTWGAGWQMQYWLFKGMSDYCTDTGTCGKYAAYMRANAAAAWSERDSHGVTWNNWTAPTQDANLDEFETSSMPALFQQLPVSAASPFHGYYHVKNADSGKLMSVQHDSKAANAPIIQETSAKDASAAWGLVRESNGYYEIRNARSGMLANVQASSGAPHAKLLQWPAQGIGQGNDQWYPVHNANGTWSFYNRNSQLALAIASTATGTQLVQEAQSNKPAQQFALIPVNG
jgi:Glycosyl hydrolase family 76/Ricin-type beta-trefoil lectin domain-like